MSERQEKMLKQITCGVVIVIITGWIGYVSLKGVTLDAMAAGLNTRVTVLETVTSTIKEDVSEIKNLTKQIREDQLRRDARERR